MDADYLDWAMADFSGYVAIDELYDGPFCVLSIVDNRTFKRLLYQVLDHDPDHADITAFLRRFQNLLTQRSLTLKGVTTDGGADLLNTRRYARRQRRSMILERLRLLRDARGDSAAGQKPPAPEPPHDL